MAGSQSEVCIYQEKVFLKTGCLMTADGTDDDEIMPQGIENYNF